MLVWNHTKRRLLHIIKQENSTNWLRVIKTHLKPNNNNKKRYVVVKIKSLTQEH